MLFLDLPVHFACGNLDRDLRTERNLSIDKSLNTDERPKSDAQLTKDWYVSPSAVSGSVLNVETIETTHVHNVYDFDLYNAWMTSG